MTKQMSGFLHSNDPQGETALLLQPTAFQYSMPCDIVVLVFNFKGAVNERLYCNVLI